MKITETTRHLERRGAIRRNWARRAACLLALALCLPHSSAASGSLWSMGYNFRGQLGDGSSIGRNKPVLVRPDHVVSIAAGEDHSFFVTADGSLWAMGRNSHGQLGNGDMFVDRNETPVLIREEGVSKAAGGAFHSLFITESGQLWGMGSNSDGQLGLGDDSESEVPKLIRADGVTAVAAGDNHSLFVTSDGELWAMGHNGSGRLGDGSTTARRTPVRIRESDVVAIAAGGDFSLFITRTGELWVMGSNSYGKLGDGTGTDQHAPVQIRESGVMQVAAGGYHSLFVTENGELWSMGDNQWGQLGNGERDDSELSPVLVRDAHVTAVAAGERYSLFITDNGELWGMGYNLYGQLGNEKSGEMDTDMGWPEHETHPVMITNNVLSITAGDNHSLLIADSVPSGDHSFAQWLSDEGLSGEPADIFRQVCPDRGVAHGFRYAFGANLPPDRPLLTIRMVNGQRVVETPSQDDATRPYVDVRVEASADLIDWSFPLRPALDTTGKPANTDWHEPENGTPPRIFFRLGVEQK